MSLLPECHRWSERALRALDESRAAGPTTCTFRRASASHRCTMAKATWQRLPWIGAWAAETSGDVVNQVAVLGMITIFHSRGGDFNTALYLRKTQPRRGRSLGGHRAHCLGTFHSGGGHICFLGNPLVVPGGIRGCHLQQGRLQRTSAYLGLDREKV